VARYGYGPALAGAAVLALVAAAGFDMLMGGSQLLAAAGSKLLARAEVTGHGQSGERGLHDA